MSDIRTIADQIDTRWLQQRRGFITGASGWFGSWACQVLEYIGAESVKLWHTEEVNIENFRIPEQDIDYIIHLAHGRVTRVIECAQVLDVEAVLFTSSGAVYAADEDEYGQRKLNNEAEIINSAVPVKIARCFTTAGPGIALTDQYVLGNFIGQALCNKDLHIWGDGSAIRTYLYITDVIVWLFKILVDGECGKPYDVGGDDEITIWELAHMVSDHFTNSSVVIENRDTRGRFPVYVPDLTETLDIGCRIEVGLDEAIDRTVEYYKGEYDE